MLDELWAAEHFMAACKPDVVEALHAAVGSEADRDRRRRLLRLKRSAFNLRPLDNSDPATLGLSRDAAESLALYQVASTRRERLRDEVRRAFGRECARARASFKGLLREPDFQAGLLLSSHSLCSVLPDYLDCDDAVPTAREEHVERGLMRYLSRMAMKATPFATFCAVVAGDFIEGDGTGLIARLAGDPRRKRSFIRLNKVLYGLLLDHLKHRPAVRCRLWVELNPTLQEEDPGRWLFLTASGGQEVFQRLDRVPVLDVIVEELRSCSGATFEQLAAVLARDDRLEATPIEIEVYLDRLISLGFLRFRSGIREQDPDWDRPFGSLLAAIEDEHATVTATLLADLRVATERYAAADVNERMGLLEGARSRIGEAFSVMGIRGALGRKPPVYEDTSASARLEVFVDPDISRGLRDLTSYTGLTLRAAWPRGGQAAMRHFFDTYYGSKRSGVPVLQFYEDYFREHFKSHLERTRRPADPGTDAGEEDAEAYNLANPFNLELVTAILDAHTRVRELVERRYRDAGDAEAVTISPDELEDALQLPPGPARCRSLSVFAQLAPSSDGDPYVILPNGRYFAGYGKYFSRFLYTLPPDIGRKVYDQNLALTKSFLAEICGDAKFNANLHPPLLRWEISYPTGETGHLEAQLPTRELDVARDPADRSALLLCHRPTGTPVIPVDLGFLNPRMRPPLYQLLSQFGPPVNFAFPLPPWRPVAPSSQQNQGTNIPEVLYRPRLVFGERLVLCRRSWSVPANQFPQWARITALADFALKVHRWRRLLGIPERVYVRIHPRPLLPHPGTPNKAPAPLPGAGEDQPAAVSAAILQADRRGSVTAKTEPSRDFLKPQYVDFANPILLNLFGRMAGRLESFDAVIEECFPAVDDLPRSGLDAFATELILQIDYSEVRAG